jgi:RNA polymerase sigma-70 factor (ECF subfamily)
VALSSLSEAFLRPLSDARRAEALDIRALETTLRRWVHEATSTWPDVVVSEECFVVHVAKRLDHRVPLAQALAEIRPADAYLAFACCERDEHALANFEKQYICGSDGVWRRSRVRGDVTLDDARQWLRVKLLVGTAVARPKLLEFGGRGDLRRWVHIVMARMLADARDHRRRETPYGQEFFLALVADKDNPERQHLKGLYNAEFKQAFSDAADALLSRDRNVLRYSLVEGLTIDEIGAAYGVHRATAARWLSRARAGLLRELRDRLATRLRVQDAELDSILRLIASQIDVTLERCLRKR